jgi:hypothetical protein
MSARVHLDRDRLAAICRNYHVHRLAVFGSALRDDFRPDSDVDLLIEFDSGFRPGLIGLHELEQELSAAFRGHRIDMVNPRYLNRRIRERVLNEAEVQFAEG